MALLSGTIAALLWALAAKTGADVVAKGAGHEASGSGSE